MGISTEELTKLRELAEAATSGPWIGEPNSDFALAEGSTTITAQTRKDAGLIDIAEVWSTDTLDANPSQFNLDQRANAAFIVAANPQTIIRLLDELERVEILANGYKTANEEAQELLNEFYAATERLEDAVAIHRNAEVEDDFNNTPEAKQVRVECECWCREHTHTLFDIKEG